MVRVSLAVILGLMIVGKAMAQQSGAHIPTLVSEWYAHNHICRGSSGTASERACALRSRVEEKLERAGMCYGVFSYGYNSTWEVCDPGQGQEVDLVRFGKVSLSNFVCRRVERSSFIYRVCHHPKTKYMVIRIRDKHYLYCKIEDDEVLQFFASASMGKFFNQHFRGKREC